MKSSRALNLFMNPFLMWSQLAQETVAMATGSAQVIAHRTSRLALVGSIPSARDRREFAVMGQEKGEAAFESARAMGVRMLLVNQQFATLAFKQMFAATAAVMSIAASRSPAESAERQSKLVRDTMTNSVVAASRLSGSTAQIARHGLKPLHNRVRGNVTRLGLR